MSERDESNKLKIRGAFIRSYHGSNPPKGDRYTTIYFTADLTDTMMASLEWGVEVPDPSDKKKTIRVIPDGYDGKYKDCILRSGIMKLTPSANENKKFAIELSMSEASDFKIVTVKDKDKEAARREVRFQIETSAGNAAGTVEKYIKVMGRERAMLDLTYAKQEKLALKTEEENAAADAEEKQGKLAIAAAD